MTLPSPLTRRDFLKTGAVGLAALALASCQPAGQAPFSPAGAWQPSSLFADWQAAAAQPRLLAPRWQAPHRSGRFQTLDWPGALARLHHALRSPSPSQVYVLLGLAPDHHASFARRLACALGGANLLRYGLAAELDGRLTLMDAVHKLYGVSQIPYFDAAQAQVVFSFGLDEAPPMLARAGYWVQFSSTPSPAAEQADEWLPAAPGGMATLAAALAARVAVLKGLPWPAGAPDLAAAARLSGLHPGQLERLVRLFASSPRPLAIPGPGALSAPAGLAAAQHILALNQLAGNFGQVGGVSLIPPLLDSETTPPVTLAGLSALIERMRAGQVKTLLVEGFNPLDEIPAALGFAAALQNVEQVIYFASSLDEMTALADLSLPAPQLAESFGYQSLAGLVNRPALAALLPQRQPPPQARSFIDALLAAFNQAGDAQILAQLPFADQLDFLRQSLPVLARWSGENPADFWQRWLAQGGWWSANPLRMPPVALPGIRPSAPSAPAEAPARWGSYPLRLSLVTASQNFPSEPGAPAIALSPAAARALRLRENQAVQIISAHGQVAARLRLQAGLAPDQAAWPTHPPTLSMLMKLLSPLMNESGSLLRDGHPIAIVAHPNS